MAAAFDTQPDYMGDDDSSLQAVQEDRRRDRGVLGILSFLVFVAIAILLLIALGFTSVPNVLGLSRSAAEAELTKAGFSVGDVSQVLDRSGTPGDVSGQTPAAGTMVRKGSSVDLQVALGDNLATVPDVAGRDAANASVVVQQAGFEAAAAEEYSDSVPLGIAVSQSPLGGSLARLGSLVTVSYSLGPQSAADVSVSHSDTDDGLTVANRGTTGTGNDRSIMNLSRAYPGASAWSSGGDIYVRLSPGGTARRVTSTGDWDTAPVISPNHKYLVFLRSSNSGTNANGLGAVSFTTFKSVMLSLPDVSFAGAQPVYYGKPVFAPSASSTQANTDWIVFAQYWSENYSGDAIRPSARLVVCNVPISSSWVSWNLQFRPARTLSLSRSGRAGCVLVTQKSGAKTIYSRNFNVTTGLYPE